MEIERNIEESIGWPGNAYLLYLPIISEFRANFSARNSIRFTELVQKPKKQFFQLFFYGGIFCSFSYLKNCPVLSL